MIHQPLGASPRFGQPTSSIFLSHHFFVHQGWVKAECQKPKTRLGSGQLSSFAERVPPCRVTSTGIAWNVTLIFWITLHGASESPKTIRLTPDAPLIGRRQKNGGTKR